jgi:hypothetical protein
MIKEYLKFYGDTKTEKNKSFSWRINSITNLPERLKYWAERVEIRAAWYVCVEDGKKVANQRIDMNAWYNDHSDDRQVILKDE